MGMPSPEGSGAETDSDDDWRQYMEPSNQDQKDIEAATVSDQSDNASQSLNMPSQEGIGAETDTSDDDWRQYMESSSQEETGSLAGDKSSRRLSQEGDPILPVVSSVVEHWWARGAPHCDSSSKFDIVELTLEHLQMEARLLLKATRAIQHINSEHGFLAALDLALSYRPLGQPFVDDM